MASPRNKLIKVIPHMVAAYPYTVTRERAEIMVARGQARWDSIGTSTIHEVKIAARGQVRHWRKVTNRSVNGAALYSSMQLVPGSQQGRNTGGRSSTSK
jgi:hypothetical protein